MPNLLQVLRRASWTPGDVVLDDVAVNVTYAGTSTVVDTPIVQGLARIEKDCSHLVLPGHVAIARGAKFRATLHFAHVSFDGLPGVAAPELPCLYQEPSQALQGMLVNVFWYVGSVLEWQGNSGGWSQYRVTYANDDAAVAWDHTNITLFQGKPDFRGLAKADSLTGWVTANAGLFVESTRDAGNLDDRTPAVLSTQGYDPLEHLDLAGGKSEHLRYSDANGDGRFGDGDVLSVKAPSSTDSFSTYWLAVSACGVPCVKNLHLVLAKRGAILEEHLPATLWQPAWRLVEQHWNETRAVTVLQGNRVLAQPAKLRDLVVRTPGGKAVPRTGDSFLGADARLDLRDGNLNGLLDAGDEIELSSAGPAGAAFILYDNATKVTMQLPFITGLGRSLASPNFALEQAGAMGTVESPPGVAPAGGTLSLWRSDAAGTVLARNVTIGTGVLASWQGGSLTFDDKDGDGRVGRGDTFTVQATPGGRYILLLQLDGEATTTVLET